MKEDNSTNSVTQYTLFEVIQRPKTALTTVFLILLILCTLVGNFLVIWTIFTNRRLRFSAFFFVASLAVADFLVGLVVLPISLAYHLTFEMRGRWIFGAWTCKAWLLSNFWFCFASVLSLCLVSWDRYIAVTSPLLYKARMSDTKVRKMIIIIWTLSFSIAIVLITQIHLHTSSRALNCTIQGKASHEFAILVARTIFFLPVLFLSFVKGKLWVVARRQNRKVQTELVQSMRLASYARSLRASVRSSQSHSENGRRSGEVQCHDSTTVQAGNSLSRTIKQEIKTFKIFLIVIGVFVICWCPFYVCIVVDTFKGLKTSIFYVSLLVSYCNSAVNIFIYGIFSGDFRKALLSKFVGCRCKCS